MLRRLKQSRFVRDAFVLQIAAGLTAGGNLLSTLALAFLLGARLQGTFYLAMALYSMFYLMGNVGLSTVTVSHIARGVGANDRHMVVAWLGFLLKAGALLALTMLLLAWFVLPPVGAYFYDDPRVAKWAMLFCFLPLIELPRVVCAAAFQGTRRMLDLAQLENTIEAGRVFLVISCVLISGRPEGVVWGTLLAGGLGSVVGVVLYRRARQEMMDDLELKAILPGVGELLRGTRMMPLRHGLAMGVQVGLVRNLDALVLNVAPMLIMGYFGGPAHAAFFRIAQSFLRMPLMFLQGISRTAVPALAELAHLEDPSRFRKTFYRATFGGGVLVSTGILLALPLIPIVTRMALPPEYAEEVPFDALLLAVGFLVTSFSGAIESFYVASHRISASLRIGMVIGLPTIPLMALGGYLIGAPGVVLATTVALSTSMIYHIHIWRCFRSGHPIRPVETPNFEPDRVVPG
jgi:O-antigen/teichoic acid export membrane protein